MKIQHILSLESTAKYTIGTNQMTPPIIPLIIGITFAIIIVAAATIIARRRLKGKSGVLQTASMV